MKEDDLILKINAIRGNTRFLVSNQNHKNANKFQIHFNVKQENNNYEITQKLRKSIGGQDGVYFICADNRGDESTYTIQAYLKTLEDVSLLYHGNLMALLKDETTSPIHHRLLLQASPPIVKQQVTPSPAASPSSSQSTTNIPINGYGIAGIAAMVIFFVTLIIALSCLDNIFVSTKFVEHPLLLGKVEF